MEYAEIDFWRFFADGCLMHLLAPGKINLHLRVGPIEANGFHPLASWFVTVGLFDTLICEPGDNGEIALLCDDSSIPTDERNLVVRAARLLQQEIAPGAGVPAARRAARFHLRKQIPAGGGLGGGSSDAARAIIALNHLWKLHLGLQRMGEIAAMLGSDVPFFLHGHSCWCTGRGEVVRRIPVPRARWAVLMLPEISISTVAVYATFDRLGLGNRQDLEQVDWLGWAQLKSAALLPRLRNDLEPAAFEMNQPLWRLRSETEQLLGRIVRMSGSGSTLFTLFDDESEARQAKEKLSVRSVVVPIAPAIQDDLAIA